LKRVEKNEGNENGKEEDDSKNGKLTTPSWPGTKAVDASCVEIEDRRKSTHEQLREREIERERERERERARESERERESKREIKREIDR
jgi:hypothetical protein